MTRTKKSIGVSLDNLARRAVKLRDECICQKCGRDMVDTGNCHWSHIYSRGRYAKTLRWDMLNALTLCPACHQKWGEALDIAMDWFRGKYPARYAYLNESMMDEFGVCIPRKNLIRPVQQTELLNIEEYLKKKVANSYVAEFISKVDDLLEQRIC